MIQQSMRKKNIELDSWTRETMLDVEAVNMSGHSLQSVPAMVLGENVDHCHYCDPVAGQFSSLDLNRPMAAT